MASPSDALAVNGVQSTSDPDRYFYEPGIETASRERIRGWQEKRVLELVPYVWERSGFYRDLWSRAGVRPEDITSLDDFFAKIPTFTKSDIRAYRERTGDVFGGLLCVDRGDLTTITSTSGTTSLPEFLPEIWDVAPPLPMTSTRALWEIGLRPGDRVLSPPGSFRGFWDDYYRMLGLVPVFIDCWIGEGERILQAVQKYEVAFLQMFTPTVMEFEALEAKYDIREMLSSLKGAAFAGQPLSAKQSRKIRDEWGVHLLTWTSAGDTGGAWEGNDRDGYYLQEDTVLAEIVDPLTGEPVGERGTGELIATDLDNDAAPYIRFRAEDLVQVSHEPGARGRTHSRIWVLGRVGDEIRVGGKPLVISQVWEQVEKLPECEDALFQIVKYGDPMDTLRLRLGYAPEQTADVDDLRERAVAAFRDELGVTVEVDLMPVSKILESVSSVAKFPRTVKL